MIEFGDKPQFSRYSKGNNSPATTTIVRTSPTLLSTRTLFLCDLNCLSAGSSAKRAFSRGPGSL
uniref:Uncharacterized protein n=1 Tax=Rhizophora mucronata TaxID=61149 RepID=A0A2P2JF95_RHIMU